MRRTDIDMTQGSPLKLILGFAVPTILGLLFQQFYGTVDAIIVGKWLGVDALAAVGSTGSISFMIVGFCIGTASGFAIPVAQRYGAGDHQALRSFVSNSVWVCTLLSFVMTALVCIFCKDILILMRTPENIIDDAFRYIFVIFLGIPVTYFYNLLAGIIRSMGDSRTPVYFLIISAALNIVFDIISIKTLKMGVAGPAAATVLSQAISGVLCLIFMVKKYEILHIHRQEWRPQAAYIRTLLAMGVPMGLQYSVTAIGSVVLQTAVNGLGSAAVASITAGNKVVLFFCCPFDALGSTMATYAGQNVGGQRIDRIDRGIKAASIIGAVYAVTACLALCLFGRSLTLLFIDSAERVILDQSYFFLVANSSFYVFLAMVNIFRFCIQGMGFSAFAILAGVCEMVARAAFGFGLVPLLGYPAACFASPIAWVMADAFLIPAYVHCSKKLRRLFAEQREEEQEKSESKGEEEKEEHSLALLP